jgi:cellulose synthase/poly-beta-1,6-N-acetylglucosamine synthase-like glycosyltransferase
MLQIIVYIIISVFIISFLIQQIYHWFIFGKLAFSKHEKVPANLEPVSIIICAKNEAQNLQKNLPLIFEQDFPEFQVVVVNDCSFDETEDILEEFEKKYSNLHVVTLKEDDIKDHYKKLALTIGIKGAKYDRLIFTDADCNPRSNQWLKKMASNYHQPTQIIIGYGAFKKTKGFLNKLIRFDGFYNATQYLSFALIGKPYMGVGRNMAYRKNFFFEKKGFSNHYHIQSGEDDLFVNANATQNNLAIEYSQKSITETEAKKTFKNWRVQKMRHLSTSKFYKASDKFRIGLLAISQYTFLLFAIFSIFATILLQPLFPYQLYIFLTLIFLRYLSLFIVLYFAMKRLNEKDLLLLTPVLEIVLMFLYPIWHIRNMFVKKHRWK